MQDGASVHSVKACIQELPVYATASETTSVASAFLA